MLSSGIKVEKFSLHQRGGNDDQAIIQKQTPVEKGLQLQDTMQPEGQMFKAWP